MGTWGVGPFDNDEAADRIVRETQSVRRVVEAKRNAMAREWYRDARVSIMQQLQASGTDILGGPSLEPALRALGRMRTDTEWLSQFRDPCAIAFQLEAEMFDVAAAIRRIGVVDVDLEAILSDALLAEIPPVTDPLLDLRRMARQRVRGSRRSRSSRR